MVADGYLGKLAQEASEELALFKAGAGYSNASSLEIDSPHTLECILLYMYIMLKVKKKKQ
jgi:hypothetical protein